VAIIDSSKRTLCSRKRFGALARFVRRHAERFERALREVLAREVDQREAVVDVVDRVDQHTRARAAPAACSRSRRVASP
jgi:hypothetical protein